jgi:cbb3-type cytochrome oxidase maturation protein
VTGLLILIPVALFLGVLGLAAFLWSLRSGQYDDLDGAAVRILQDEDWPDRNLQSTSGRAGGVDNDRP